MRGRAVPSGKARASAALARAGGSSAWTRRLSATSAGLVVSAQSSTGPGVLTASCSNRPPWPAAISSAGAPSRPGPVSR